MATHGSLTTTEIHALFAEEIAALGGTVSDTFHDDARLFLRAVLPRFREVGREDSVQCGVALRVLDQEVRVHPYVFRLICKNGAIWAHALQAERIEAIGAFLPERAEARLREAIRACSSEEAFETTAQEMRAARQSEADLILTLMPMLSELPATTGGELLRGVLRNFQEEGDITRFGLMNAITAVARDTEDPEQRWRLEEWGGGIPRSTPAPVLDASAAESLLAAYLASLADTPTDALENESAWTFPTREQASERRLAAVG